MDKITRAWIRSVADEKAVAAGCTFDLKAADRVRKFFAEFLCHSKGEFAGKPFELLDWQWQGLIAPLYGWKKPNGARRYRTCSAWVAKKNGKSTIAAGVVLYGLVADGESGAEVYGAAADRTQASVIYRECAAMVRQSPALAKRLRIVDTTKRIIFGESFYTVLSKESKKTGHGVNAHLVVIDELHVVDRPLYDTLRYAGSARKQPLLLEISTAGDDCESFGHERYEYAKKVHDGVIEDAELLVYIAEAEQPQGNPNGLWHQQEQWQKANPSLGTTMDLDRFRSDFQTASNGTALDKAAFCQLRLNIWQQSANPWVSVDRWDQCPPWPLAATARPDLADVYPLPVDHLLGKACFAALDLSSTLDLCALSLLFPQPDESYDALAWYWAPANACRERERLNKARLDGWVADGWIHKTEGDVIDYGQIRLTLDRLNQLFCLQELAFDPWNATQFALELQQAGYTVVEFAQTIGNFTGPMKDLEKLILTGKLRHGGNKVLRWNLGNVMAIKDASGNIRPCKKKSREKIDGIVALIMARGRSMVTPIGSPSVNWI